MGLKNKYMLITFLSVLIIACILSTVAIYTWTSSTNTNVALTLNGLDAYINYKEGKDTINGSLVPGSDYASGISTEIELWRSPDFSGDIYATIFLDIESIGTNMKTALKWAIVSNDVLLDEGDFVGEEAGNSINLVDYIKLKTTKQTFTVYIWLDETMSIDSEIVDEEISVIVRAEASAKVISDTLINLGLRQFLKEGTPDFSAPESTNAGIYETEDDYGTSYYFRGAVKNNYVKFAGYNWRIVRINGDGSIRLIYEGKNEYATAATEQIKFNENANDNAYVGFMYTEGLVHGLDDSSTAKVKLDEWYENSGLKNFEQYIDANAGFCGDRQPSTEPSFINGEGGTSTTFTIYASDIRLRENQNPSTPSLKCVIEEDLYTHKSSVNGNKKLDNPVGLITADEVVFAGGFWVPPSGSYIPNLSHYLNIEEFYWTMTPSRYYSAGTRMIVVNNKGYVTSAPPNYQYVLRPVINLKADTEFLEDGTGTKDNPFVVKTTGTQILSGKDIVNRPEINTTLISSTTNKVYETEDNDGTSYYFAGNPTDNYVEFAGYDWRIVRINGDGTVRLIYEGKNGNAIASTKTSMFNENANDNAYVGFMYTKDEVHGLDNPSNAKDKLDEWYNNSGLKDYEQYIDINAGFCGDREPSDDSNDSTIYYAGDIRLQSNKNPSIPSLKCIANEDLYTHKSSVKGNMKLDNPVGLITADEVVFAGGFWVPRGATDQKHYLNIGVAYWTMTPRIYYSAGARMMIVTDNGYITSDSPSAQYVLRPVINLKTNLKVTGTGVQDDPYKFELK